MTEYPFRCPHGKDKSHGGLGKPWCDAGIEGAKYLAEKEKLRSNAQSNRSPSNPVVPTKIG